MGQTPHHQKLRLSGACLALVLLSAGCAQVYDVKVDAMQNPDLQQSEHAYRLVAKDPSRAESDPNYRKAVQLVSNALSGHGMYEAPKPEDAKVVVEIDYGVGARREEVRTEDQMDTSLGGPIVRTGSRIRGSREPIVFFDDQPVVRTREVYEKRLTIVAREAKRADENEDGPPRELWRVEVKVDDEKDDVDKVLPVLVGAAVDHIGTDNGASQRNKRISDKSEPVNFVKGGS